MNYNIKAKPTHYNGINFRSRLEAKWATFFDYAGWNWQYEPSEIGGYNPDFIIKCKSRSYGVSHIIVEIKPSIMVAEEAENMINKYKNVKAHLLLLSDFPFVESETNKGLVQIGIGSQYLGECPDYHFHDELYSIDVKDERCDIGSYYMIYDGMIWGDSERKSFIEFMSEEHIKLSSLWDSATNKTQFKV